MAHGAWGSNISKLSLGLPLFGRVPGFEIIGAAQ
jgi:hypothetical protein